ncbi:MAG TPA: acetoacetate--CoA ligase, partial [Acidimicrobiales bacterium]|nr:acetoacetate--CoA ligase [Acidimicrobiales bacterium]
MVGGGNAAVLLERMPGAADSAMARFIAWLSDGGRLDAADYEQLWTWSVEHPEEFWAALWDFFGVRSTSHPETVLADRSMPGATWFPGVRLNYAEQVFTQANPQRAALVVTAEGRDPVEVSWTELRRSVAGLAASLRAWGVKPGDRVGAYLPNIPEAVVGLLAAASVGAVWSCVAPDYGTQSVIDRFAQIEPVVLLVTDGYHWAGKRVDRRAEATEIAAALASVRQVVSVGHLFGDEPVPSGWLRWGDAVAPDAELAFEPVPFDHPLWILYSSGTTGLPKGIVHGHGGIILEHLKWLGLHNDVRPGDRFFWYTTTAWVVWNVIVGSLLTGATAVLYDGSPAWPAKDAVWRVAAQTGATHLGLSAGYVTACQKAGLRPGTTHDLSAVRCIMSTGSPLPVDAWHWVYDAVKADVWLDAPSGGTDVAGAYVGGCPLKPVVAGEMQCRLLGTRVEAWSDDGKPLVDEVGELVVTAAMPSMPLYFWGDPDGRRYHDAYFDTFPGVWRHGDFITITSRGTAIVHGRSDSTLNRHGVRMGSADIYAAVEELPEIAESLVIGAEFPDGRYYMPLFVVLAEGSVLDDDLTARIKATIRQRCSPRHVPDEIM